MTAKNRYSQQFKEQAVRQALLRGHRTIAAELGVSHHNLKNWLAHPQFAHLCADSGEKRAEQWSAAERLVPQPRSVWAPAAKLEAAVRPC